MSFLYHYFAPMNEYKRIPLAYKQKDFPADFENTLKQLSTAAGFDGKIAPYIMSELKKIAKRRKVKNP